MDNSDQAAQIAAIKSMTRSQFTRFRDLVASGVEVPAAIQTVKTER